MALRATSGPTCSTRSAKPGDPVGFTAKIENTGADPADVALAIEGLHTGATNAPLDFTMVLEPGAQQVPAKSRRSLAWTWRAALPEGKEAHTYRGKMVLRRVSDAKVVGEAALDLYVGR